MAVSVFDHDNSSLESILESNTVSLVRTKANAHTAVFAPGFEAFHLKLMGVMNQEISLRIQVYQAEAQLSAAGEGLSDMIDIVAHSVLIHCGGDRSGAFFVMLFGDKRPSELKRSKLPERLAKAQSWIGALKNAPQASLSALGAELETKVNEVHNAQEAVDLARQTLKEFRTLGARAALIDEFNALRALVYGQIAEFAHKHPELNLPSRFADRFFRHETARKQDGGKALGSEELALEIERREGELMALKQAHVDAMAREEEEAKADAAAEALKEELLEAQKAQSEAAAKVAALKAKVAAL